LDKLVKTTKTRALPALRKKIERFLKVAMKDTDSINARCSVLSKHAMGTELEKYKEGRESLKIVVTSIMEDPTPTESLM
jgi:hypothetical protein